MGQAKSHRIVHFSNRSVWIRRLARAMVNLAIPEQGKLLDPFCGTGGLIIEGILCDIDSYGSDLAWPWSPEPERMPHGLRK